LIPGLIAAAVGYGVYFALLHTSYLGIYSFPNFASFRLVDLGLALLIGVIAGFIGVMFKVIGTIKLKGDRKDCQMSGDDIQKDCSLVLAIFFNPNHTIGAAKATIE
jgi:H+/Cl- antiporter ClcA